jgi:hypothetical protein
VASTAADFSFSRASGFAFFEERSDEFPAARAPKKLSIAKTSRARDAPCRDAPAARTFRRARGSQNARTNRRQVKASEPFATLDCSPASKLREALCRPARQPECLQSKDRDARLPLRIDRFAKSPAVSIRPF